MVTSGKRGLGAELEEVETRNEEYPMTRAFLYLGKPNTIYLYELPVVTFSS